MLELLTVENLIALLTLTSLEIVLGIDNLVFITILTGKLPAEARPLARRIGVGLAMFGRIGLLLAISWVMGLTRAWFEVIGHSFSGKDLILLGGGLFLIAKSTYEIHDQTEGPHEADIGKGGTTGFGPVIAQIVVIDLVFSLDSVITAVGMAREVAVMVAAIVASVAVMMYFAGAVSDFVEEHPTIKVLALSFLLLIGVMLTAEGLGRHIEKGYIYFAMSFSLVVEMINLRVHKTQSAAAQGGG